MRHVRPLRPALGAAMIATMIAVTPAAARVIDGTEGPDQLYGTPNPDLIRGHKGNDLIVGYAGGDSLRGGTGNDRIRGGPGGDYIEGADGNDHMRGGSGPDWLTARRGDDTMIVNGDTSVDHVFCGGGVDVVYHDPEDIIADGCETKILVTP